MRMADVKMLKRVGFIGAGQMAEALARGFIAKGVLQAGDITANDPSAERKKVFQSFDAKAAASNIEVGHRLCSRSMHQASKICCDDSSYTSLSWQVVENSEIVFLAVKPQFVQPVLKEVREHLTERHTIVSIAAGKTLASLLVRPSLLSVWCRSVLNK